MQTDMLPIFCLFNLHEIYVACINLRAAASLDSHTVQPDTIVQLEPHTRKGLLRHKDVAKCASLDLGEA